MVGGAELRMSSVKGRHGDHHGHCFSRVQGMNLKGLPIVKWESFCHTQKVLGSKQNMMNERASERVSETHLPSHSEEICGLRGVHLTLAGESWRPEWTRPGQQQVC